MPFYMAYPISVDFEGGRTENRDLEYLRSLYPDMAKRILPYIEEEFDRMDYRFSMVYDEYPDKLQLRMMCRRVHDRVSPLYREKQDGLCDLIEVMMYHELYKRRCDNRRSQRKFYLNGKI